MTNRGPTAEEIALGFRRLHFFNIALAGPSKIDGALKEVCDLAEAALVRALKEAIAGAKPEWKTIDSAPKDGTPILVCLDIPASDMHDDLKRWQGVIAVMRHPGVEAGSFDIGWNMAAPVGHGGFPDRWIAGWQPNPDPPNLPPEHQDEGK